MQNRHPVVRFPEGDYLVDTGSPLSFNYLGIPGIEIDGREYTFGQIRACPKETADALTGGNIVGFIGMDILQQTGLTIDFENQSLFFRVGQLQTIQQIPRPSHLIVSWVHTSLRVI